MSEENQETINEPGGEEQNVVNQQEVNQSAESTNQEGENNTHASIGNKAEHNASGYNMRHENKRLKTELEQLKRTVAGIAQQQAPVQQPQQTVRQPVNNGVPTVDQFEDPDEYIDARVQHAARNIIQQQKAMEVVEGVQNTFLERTRKFAEKCPEIFTDIQLMANKLNPMIEDAIMKNENGPAILHELSNDERMVQNINIMAQSNPIAAITQLQELSEKAKAQPNFSNAPAPIGSTEQQAPLDNKKSLSGLSQEEHNQEILKYYQY